MIKIHSESEIRLNIVEYKDASFQDLGQLKTKHTFGCNP